LTTALLPLPPAGEGWGEGTLTLRPIGRLRTPFATLKDCPRNGRKIQPPPDCIAEVDAAFQEGLKDIETFSHLILLYWLGPQPDLLTISPNFAKTAGDRQPHGIFATRTPVRPNPIGLSVVSLHGIDGGHLTVRNLDCRDGTPLLDIKPYLPSTDLEPGATMGWQEPYRTPR
jgi:tRNA-Thr(GGU) m(6)t(6)A37 methyltransferase TsaA